MRTVQKVQPVMTNVHEKAQKMGKKRYDYFRIDTGERGHYTTTYSEAP